MIRTHFKTYFYVILNEVKDLISLKIRDSSLRSEWQCRRVPGLKM